MTWPVHGLDKIRKPKTVHGVDETWYIPYYVQNLKKNISQSMFSIGFSM